MSARGKILVIRGGAIGDFILTLPALSALRLQFPNVHLEVLGYPHIADLAVAGKIVDRVRSIESRPLANFFARGGDLLTELAEYFLTFDIIVSYLYDPDRIFQTNVASCSKAQFIVGPHRPDEKLKVHATKVFLQPLERLAIFDADSVPQLSLNDQPKVFNQLALHPGSGSEKKIWSPTKWVDLIQRILDETDRDLLLIGGEAEGAWLSKMSSNLPSKRCAFAENLPLVDLGAILQNCAAFVGHDSGISHLAAALNLPGIILWGDTVEEIWAPNNSKTKIIRGENGLATISVPEVFGALNNLKHGETLV
jgi:heptosyltransferase-2